MIEQVVCVDNIGPRETRKRLLFGVITAVLAAAAAVGLVAAGAGRILRALLFAPAALAALGFLQARART